MNENEILFNFINGPRLAFCVSHLPTLSITFFCFG